MTTTTLRSGGQLLVDQLKIHGADLAFCVPGESYLPVLDALYENRDSIKLITCRHESGAANMAEAYGKLTGKPGICLVTRGPGATNASIGVHTAFQDSTPMILFIGQVGNDFVEREAFQEIDYRRMFGQMAKWVAQIDRADRVPEFIARAYQVPPAGAWGRWCWRYRKTCSPPWPMYPMRAPGSASRHRPGSKHWCGSPACCRGRNGRLS